MMHSCLLLGVRKLILDPGQVEDDDGIVLVFHEEQMLFPCLDALEEPKGEPRVELSGLGWS